jgi:glutamate synthase domain-containing protein 1
VHNGEISSYGTNVRYLEMFGYKCALLTDTEVVAYTMDLLMRRHKLPVELAAAVIAPPLWSEIEHMNEEEKKVFTSLRQVYGSLLLNGPFAFIIANENEMIGITDRIRLRPLVAGKKGDFYFMASEEAGIREVSPELEEVWAPRGGEPIVARLIQKEPLETVVQEEAI